MQTFPYVEDYLFWIVDLNINSPTSIWMFSSFASNSRNIRFASYDVDIISHVVDRLISQVVPGNIPTQVTTRQAALVRKILLKYKNQFSKFDIDISPVESIPFKYPLVESVTRKSIEIHDNKIILSFPYNKSSIATLKSIGKKYIQGYLEWNHDKKHWQAPLTEQNLVSLATWAAGFERSDEVSYLLDRIEEIEQQPAPVIELTVVDGQLTIRNAPDSMVEYISNTITPLPSEVTSKAVDLLVDAAPIFEYQVDPAVRQVAANGRDDYIKNIQKFIDNKITVRHADGLHAYIDQAIKYAREFNRCPIIVFDPLGGSNSVGSYIKDNYSSSRKVYGALTQEDFNGSCDIFLANSPKQITVPDDIRIPLVMSSVTIVRGQALSDLLARAEKVIVTAFKLP